MKCMKGILSLIFLGAIVLIFTSCSKHSVSGSNMALEDQTSNSVVFVSLNYPPYYYLNSEKKVEGRCVEVVKEMCRRIGIEPTFQLLSWRECLDRGKKGMVDGVLCLSKTKMREYFYYYPRVNLDLAEYVIFQNSRSGRNITSLEDLKGKKVGVVDGIAYPKEFMDYKGCEKVVVGSPTEAMKWLASDNGKIDCIIEILDVGNNILDYLKASAPYLESDDIKPTSLVFQIDPIYIGIPKRANQSEALYRKIDKELLKMQHSGEIFKILSDFDDQ